MNIVLCVREDMNGNLALNHFLKNVAIDSHRVSVILSRHVSKDEKSIPELVAFECLESGMLERYFALLDCYAPKGSDSQNNFTFRQLANYYNISIKRKGRVRTSEYKNYMKSLEPDLIISCRYDYIFDADVIRIPKLGILNIHPGALPFYRGLFSPFHGLKNGEKRLGVTVHWIDEGIDTGNIIAIRYLDCVPGKAVFDYYNDLYLLGMGKVIELVEQLENGRDIESSGQSGGDYYGMPSPAELSEFAAAGHKLIDYHSYINRIQNFYQ